MYIKPFCVFFQSSTSGLFYKFHQSNGVSFNISSDLANRMALKNLIKTLEQKGAEHFVIAMAAGKHQFEESIPAIVSIHRHLPKHTIYYYDLGLASEQAKEVWKSLILFSSLHQWEDNVLGLLAAICTLHLSSVLHVCVCCRWRRGVLFIIEDSILPNIRVTSKTWKTSRTDPLLYRCEI